jgi:hypothetical protein
MTNLTSRKRDAHSTETRKMKNAFNVNFTHTWHCPFVVSEIAGHTLPPHVSASLIPRDKPHNTN